MLPIQKKQKNSFIVKLHKDLYPKKLLEGLIGEDKEWVTLVKLNDASHFQVEFTTPRVTDVLEWTNFLFYLSKVS